MHKALGGSHANVIQSNCSVAETRRVPGPLQRHFGVCGAEVRDNVREKHNSGAEMVDMALRCVRQRARLIILPIRRLMYDEWGGAIVLLACLPLEDA